jgi:acylphosphatase
MTTTIWRRFIVRGLVQGVGFRAATQRKARALGVVGWVRNLPDGRVEALAGGAPEALEALHAWLYQGPTGAVVDDVVVTEAEPHQLPPQPHALAPGQGPASPDSDFVIMH